jgi:DDE superfamily endonuclease/Helix-turn-helix of DDE superfamily endonuclease
MDARRRRALLQCVVVLAQPPPDVRLYQNMVLSEINFLSQPPPDPLVDIRHRLFSDDNVDYQGRDIFEMFAGQPYCFFEVTGETPETFVNFINPIQVHEINNILSKRNRFMLVFMWLRSYPCYSVLSAMFNISVSTIKREIRQCLTILDDVLEGYLQWPSIQEWLSLRGAWRRIPMAVGAIDGTSHEIYRPVQNQEQFYSGHRHFHCMHSQIVIDNTGLIRHTSTGFLGHLNDAQQYRLMPQIGNELPFPQECVLLADKIYANGYPLMTPFTTAQLRRKRGNDRHKALRLNRYIARHRIAVEHSIAELKTYRCVNSVWRHPRHMLSQTVSLF